MSAVTTTDREIIEQIGREYVESTLFPQEGGDAIAEAYGRIAATNADKYDRMLNEVAVEWTTDDPYSSYDEMKQSVAETNVLRVFSGGSEPPLMSHRENVIGRAVHDYYGHLAADVDFSPEGEYGKWRHVWPDYSTDRYGLESRIMFAEVVGQLCAAFYLPDGFDDERFKQRAIAAPVRWIEAFDRLYGDRVGEPSDVTAIGATTDGLRLAAD